jgi:orotidine-5'-phosphate decarboxylase
MITTDVPVEVRDRMVLGLDVGALPEAEAIARRVAPWFGVVKIGYELYAESGPAAFDRMHELGFRIFCDLKLHDIPTTVERGARSLTRHGIEFLNAHAAGGTEMLRAFVAGTRAGADDIGAPPPVTLAVTVLTSDADTGAFAGRLTAARDAGCDGVVCSAREVPDAAAAGLATMVPGIRLPGGAHHDQARVATPAEAISTGANWIILARAVTAAPDPEAAAAAAAGEVVSALASS